MLTTCLAGLVAFLIFIEEAYEKPTRVKVSGSSTVLNIPIRTPAYRDTGSATGCAAGSAAGPFRAAARPARRSARYA